MIFIILISCLQICMWDFIVQSNSFTFDNFSCISCIVVSKWYRQKPMQLGSLNLFNWLQVLCGCLKPRGRQYTPFGGVRASISKSVSPWTCLWQWYSTCNVCVSASGHWACFQWHYQWLKIFSCFGNVMLTLQILWF